MVELKNDTSKDIRTLVKHGENEGVLLITDDPEVAAKADEIVKYLREMGVKTYLNLAKYDRSELRTAYKQIQTQRQVVLNNIKSCNENLSGVWPEETPEFLEFEKHYNALTDPKRGMLVKRQWQAKLEDNSKTLNFLEEQTQEIKNAAPEVLRE